MKSTRSVVGAYLQANGFTQVKQNWVYQGEETTCRIKLERVRYKKGRYYLRYYVRILPLSLWRFEGPVLSGTMYSPYVQDKVELEACLNENIETLGPVSRLNHLDYMMREKVIPFLHQLRTVQGIRRMYMDGVLRGSAIHKELADFLMK